MKFLIDEDMAIEVARCRQQQGHEVSLVADVSGTQTGDDQIWSHAIRTGSIVITCNRQDFLELAGTNPETGLIILNRRRTQTSECRHVLQLLDGAGETGLDRNINFV